jgi:hypothetical protein
MNQLASDIRSGVRLLLKYPTLSLAAVLTLGLGIGLATTVFSVVNGGLFKGLPFPDAERIIAVVATNPLRQQPRQPIRRSAWSSAWREPLETSRIIFGGGLLENSRPLSTTPREPCANAASTGNRDRQAARADR